MNHNKQPKILVVEDDAISQIVIKNVFKKLSCEIDFVSSAEAGLDIYQEKDHDIIFVDIGLPGEMDGIDMIEFIRNTEKGQTLPLIVLTAHMHENEQQRLYQANATKIVIKPLTWPTLQDIISEFLPEAAII